MRKTFSLIQFTDLIQHALNRGQVCKNFLAQKYVFVQPPFTQAEVEQKLFGAFSVIMRSK